MSTRALIKKYPQRCPRCKTLHEAIWKTCVECKVPLVPVSVFQYRLQKYRFRIYFGLIVILFSVYSYQEASISERVLYQESVQHLIEGKPQMAWEEFRQAFSSNPASQFARTARSYVKATLESVTGKNSEGLTTVIRRPIESN
ncbi:MAG: hypothetical protein EXS63_08275 [Candidatus Omnitrophica bacterium]|nr:hypothetical protein [Candidatus Omnitrophota bacterium]